MILGRENQSFLNDSFYLEPFLVIINGKIKKSCKKFCEFEYEENDVTLYFNKSLQSCEYMFSLLKKIKEIDLSNFDFSGVTSMLDMFRDCNRLEKIEFGNINTSSVLNMEYLFYNCTSLTSINVSNFDTSSVTTMNRMFTYCKKLTTIDISNFKTKNCTSLRSFINTCELLTSFDISHFDTSKVTSMYFMFNECKKLKYINFGKKNTSILKEMSGLFYSCRNLEYIDLSSFDTSSVTEMKWIFYGCFSLKSIKLSENFNTSNVDSMFNMFSQCHSLISLNLSSFDTSKVTDMGDMFNNCKNLKYLDIPHFSPINIISIRNMFVSMNSLIYLNIYSLEINNNIDKTNAFKSLPKNLTICANAPNMKNYLSTFDFINNCSDICFNENIKLDIIANVCIKSCKENDYNYELNNICYNQCPNDTHVIIKDINNKENVFIEYDDGVAICLDENPEGYYLDNDGFYEKCFDSCKFCYGAGNDKDNNCKICKDNFLFLNDSLYNNSCYEQCEYNYYFNESNDYICTENCSGIHDRLIIEKKKCIDKCQNDDTYKYEYNKICYIECPNGTNYSEIDGICIEIKNLETTSFTTEIINKDFTSILNNLKTSNIIKTTFLEEIIHTTNPFQYKTTIPQYLHDTIIETEINSLSSKNQALSSTESINGLSQTIKDISQIIYQSSEYIHKTNYIIIGNNEEVYQGVIDNIINNYDINKGEEMVFKGEDNFIFHITNSQNELELLKGNNNNTNKVSIIDLGECENLLKKYYQINENVSLIIIKFEKISDNSSERFLQY